MHNFKVGEKVKVRSWDDMASEYGLVSGNIPVPATFVPDMKNLCGEEAVIAGFALPNQYHHCTTVYLDFKTTTKGTVWTFSPEMLEPIM